MEIVLLILGFAIGFLFANIRYYKLLVGKLKVQTDPEDGQHYLFLELSKSNVQDVLKKKFIVLEVDLGRNSSQK